MSAFLKKQSLQSMKTLEAYKQDDHELVKAWNVQNKVTLAQVILFNRLRQGEASKMTPADYKHLQKPTTYKPDRCTFQSGKRAL